MLWQVRLFASTILTIMLVLHSHIFSFGMIKSNIENINVDICKITDLLNTLFAIHSIGWLPGRCWWRVLFGKLYVETKRLFLSMPCDYCQRSYMHLYIIAFTQLYIVLNVDLDAFASRVLVVLNAQAHVSTDKKKVDHALERLKQQFDTITASSLENSEYAWAIVGYGTSFTSIA